VVFELNQIAALFHVKTGKKAKKTTGPPSFASMGHSLLMYGPNLLLFCGVALHVKIIAAPRFTTHLASVAPRLTSLVATGAPRLTPVHTGRCWSGWCWSGWCWSGWLCLRLSI
jgi:hypothetical protein